MVAQQHPLHQKKATGWSKFLLDGSVFEQPLVQQKAPAMVALVEAVVEAPFTAAAAGVPSQRPRTGDSTATLALDTAALPPVRTPAAERTAPQATPTSSESSRPQSCLRRPSPAAEGHGWDLQVPTGCTSGVEEARGMKFWKKPWKPLGRSTHVSVPDENAVASFSEGVEDVNARGRTASRAGSPLDSRAVTPWAAVATQGGVEEIITLPGVMEEEPMSSRRSLRRPTREPAASRAQDFADDDLVGAIPTFELD